jgi:hypothetical protein
MTKYVYHCLTSEGTDINIEAEEALFIDELIETAGRDDLMITGITITEQ